MKKTLKLDKNFLAKVSCASKTAYREQSYSDGVDYLEPSHLVAKAWITAYESVLNSYGYEIVKKKEVLDEKT